MSGPSPSGPPDPAGGAGAADRPGPVTTAASAVPPPAARLAAFAAIVVAGVCGGLIGYAVTDKSCSGDCQTAAGGVGLLAAVGAAVGVAIVAVLVLRAMGEWQATPEEVRRAAREKAHRKRQGPRRRRPATPSR
jgi:hypothetical protein